jgi:hypothetical protein
MYDVQAAAQALITGIHTLVGIFVVLGLVRFLVRR